MNSGVSDGCTSSAGSPARGSVACTISVGAVWALTSAGSGRHVALGRTKSSAIGSPSAKDASFPA